MAEGFVPFPKTLLRAMPVLFKGNDPIGFLQVVLAVVDYDRPHLKSEPSAAYLAHLAGMTEEVFMHRVADLVRMKLATQTGDADNLHINLGPLKAKIAALIAAEEDGGGGDGNGV